MSNGLRHQLKPKTPSGAARFSYINRRGKYDRDKADLVHSADHNMPDFAKPNAMLFWEAADEYERSNARICLEIELNLPQELKTVAQQIAVVEKYIQQIEKQAGRFPTSYAIHNDKDGRNPHVHFMFSERNLDGIDRPAEKFFSRANTKAPENGGTKKSTWWHKKQNIFLSRAAWADSCNEVLKESGFKPRFDPRSKAQQRAEAIKNGDLARAVELSTMTEKHEGAARGGIRKRLAAGDLQREEVQPEVLEVLDSNDFVKDFNRELMLFAAVASDEQLSEFLECDEPTQRVAFIADLYTPTPTPAAELEHIEDLEHEHDFRAQFSTDGNSNTNSKGVYEHTQALYVMQARRNNQILQGLDSQRQACDFTNIGNSVFTPVQSRGATPHSSLLTLRGLELARNSTLVELEKASSKAERDAELAELSLDIAQCAFDDLKEQIKQLKADIDNSKPVGVEKLLVAMGIVSDDSKVLQSELAELQKRIKQDAEDGKKLGALSVELRTHADELLERVEALQLQQPKPEPEPQQDAKAKQDAPQAQQSALDSFFESRGFAEALEAPAQAQEAKQQRPARGPRI